MIKTMQAFIAAFFTLFCLLASAQMPQPPEIAARAFLVLDVTANQMLAGRDIDAPVEPASLTKLMTQYLVFDALRSKKIDLKQTLPVSRRNCSGPAAENPKARAGSSVATATAVFCSVMPLPTLSPATTPPWRWRKASGAQPSTLWNS